MFSVFIPEGIDKAIPVLSQIVGDRFCGVLGLLKWIDSSAGMTVNCSIAAGGFALIPNECLGIRSGTCMVYSTMFPS